MTTDSGRPVVSTEAAALWNHLWTLECAYWADADFNFGERAADYYTDDAVFDIGLPGSRLEGRAAIRKFYAGRRDGGARTTMHVVNNFALLHWSSESARACYLVFLYGRDGTAPQESGPAVLVTAAENSYVAERDGTWKISSRVNAPHFVDPAHLPLDRIRQAAAP